MKLGYNFTHVLLFFFYFNFDKTQVTLFPNFTSITIWLPFNIIRNRLRLQSLGFAKFWNLVISSVKLEISAEISIQNYGVICHPWYYRRYYIQRSHRTLRVCYIDCFDLWFWPWHVIKWKDSTDSYLVHPKKALH